MRVVFMGTPDFAVGTLRAIVKAGHEVTGVITQPDKPVGRKMELKPTAVKAAALELGLPVYQPEKVRETACVEKIREMGADVIVVAAFGQIIPKSILEMPKYGCMNVHASLLPKYRGAAPIQWAILDGEKVTGVTIMQMNEGLDTGDMIATVEVPIRDDETGGSLFDRLAESGADLLVQTLARAEAGDLHPVPQPAESTTAYARMIRKNDGLIDWTKDAAYIERQIRAFDPWPAAFTKEGSKTLKIWKADKNADAGGDATAAPGTVLGSDKNGIRVQTGDGILRITELQLEGKKRMKAADYLRGRAIEAGEKLG
ncbi:MAG: methionyl-tRNA formyltransferase [Eubacterium sp.]|nr:methionyl-tRNA formyltransferase [Eubacterium sp.]